MCLSLLLFLLTCKYCVMSLKASVQYDDLLGTAAADGHESLLDLRNFLKSKGVDLDKNEPVGIELYNLDDRICVRFICKEQGNRLVAFELKDSLSLADLFSFIKRLNVILLRKDLKVEDCDLSSFKEIRYFDEQCD